MPVESSELLVRAAALYLPITIAITLALHARPNRRQVAAALLATVWNMTFLLVVNLVAERMGWWSFNAHTATVADMPADLWMGWALLWGAVPLLANINRLFFLGVGLIVTDLILMPMAAPVLVLSDAWLIGEAVAVVTCLVPGLLLGHWTAQNERLTERVTLQIAAFTGLIFFVLPTLIFTMTKENWEPLLNRPRWQFVLVGVLASPVGAIAIQAVREFARHGGTPVPLDPPTQLVTTGPYAYIANPMQLTATILLAIWGMLLASPAVVAAAVMSAVFSAGLAAWNENNELVDRFGDEWIQYRKAVRLWSPRWRPNITQQAVVYVAGSCEPCSEVGGFLSRRDPIGLDIKPAEECPFIIERITYQQGDTSVAGIAAIGRSLEHVNLAWATISWIGRLPGIQNILQLITDSIGGEPRSIRQTSELSEPNSSQPYDLP